MKLLASLFILFFLVGAFAASVEFDAPKGASSKRPFRVVKKPARAKHFWKRDDGEAKNRQKRDDYYYYYYYHYD